MSLRRNQINPEFFNREATLPFELRLKNLVMALQDTDSGAQAPSGWTDDVGRSI